ncbi:methyl-accepting chemotaxis protein [Paraburkholderia phytofirmans]|uniref:methyl-accepting chemotaxis protein n=1 Tax=Paraburkholderia phytofirmans TaxID=261302 RepID=UPI0007B6085C|nr:methyl-accepting chemotaxis protein [Paraburkholderia phytofirmans]
MNITISKRIAITLAIAVLSMVFIGSYGTWQLSGAQHRFEYFQDNVTRTIADLTTGDELVFSSRIRAYRYLTHTDPSIRAETEQQMSSNNEKIRRVLGQYEENGIADEADRKLLELDKTNLVAFAEAQRKFIEVCEANNTQEALAMQEEGGSLRTASIALQTSLETHAAFKAKAGADLRADNAASYTRSFWTLVTVISLAALLSGTMAVLLQRGIRQSLTGIRSALEESKETLDLTRKAPVHRMDEIGHTATAFNELLARVAEVIASVRQSAGAVSIASQEIASGNTDLSARTEEQAASLEQTASSMTQLTETVKQNADNARHANTLATSATDMTDSGNEAVQAMVKTIEMMSDSSGKISEITGVIEGIAFQTNILALNAAVEAARAGEQGRGFAVVASEVRSLAQRSSAAAKEIKNLIESSVATIHDGARQAVDVGTTMGHVKQAIKQVSDIVGEIAAASGEQKNGVEQIAVAVNQMDEVTQQNAALVEQAAAASQSLEQQANNLKDVVSVFKVSEAEHAGSHVPARRGGTVPPVAKPLLQPRTAPARTKTGRPNVSGGNIAAVEAADSDWQAF